MSDFDLIIRGGVVVTETSARLADIGVAEGRIVELHPGLDGLARGTIDAEGLHVFPGVIDSHVHFNEPGRTDWEGFETGSRALAAGGGTLFFDMPLNASPPTLDAASFDQKLAAAECSSLVDFAFWGGLVPGRLDSMEELFERGAVGFKAFMSNSGINDFPRADDTTLREGMKRAASFGSIVAVHAESERITAHLAQESLAGGKTSVRDFLNSRPVEAELEAINRATEMAAETRCRLHIVHVSCGAGLAAVSAARKAGVDVTCETCPHYLVLTEDDMIRLGGAAKCAPPLRPSSEQDGLWSGLQKQEIRTVGSDHSPSPPEMKKGENFFKVWGGISGVQHMLPLLLSEGHFHRGLALPQVAKLVSFNVASRFRLPPEKGRIIPGADADFALVSMGEKFTVTRESLLYRHPQSPYIGRALTGKVVRTILRGRTVFENGEIVSEPMGRLVRPSRAEAT